jgi:FKBP-type peptidyl-prolyl cis-trans isomerase (trigger factor)
MAKHRANKNHKKPSEASHEQPVTSATLEDHRRQVLKNARKFVKPLGVSRRRFIILTITLIAGVAIIFLAVFGLLIYRSKSDNNLVYRVSQIIPYPAAKVNGTYISYGDYLFELNPQIHYLQSSTGADGSAQKAVDFSTPEGKKKLQQLEAAAFTSAKQTAIIQQLAKKNHIKVSKKEVDDVVNQFIQQQGGEKKFKESIQSFYGWNMHDFRRAIYTKRILPQKLQPIYSTDQRKKAEDILVQINAGANFEELAKQYSEDPSNKDKGGDLGFVSKGTFVKEFEDAAFNLQPGQVSGIVESPYGFHIIKVTEKKDDQIHVEHILIKYTDINKIISDKLSQASQKNYIKVEAPAQ